MAAPPIVPVRLILYPRNSQNVEIDGLKDQNGTYLNAATVTGTLVDQNGNNVPGFINLTLVYTSASEGVYVTTVSGLQFNPPEGDGYTLVLDAAQGAAIGHWEIKARVQQRTM